MQLVSFLLLRLILGILGFFPLSVLSLLAKMISPICYFVIAKYRKRALSNLQLASDLNLSRPEIKKIAKKSLYHLLLTALEYGKLKQVNNLKKICKCLNSFETDQLLNQKKGVVFFCGHQSNWELLFLDATSRHMGVCIGKPIKNKRLYKYILAIRQKFKGKVITPKDAYKGCMKALKAGQLVGVVGDQGLPESSFQYNCLGRTASMTTLPALLASRSGCPIYVATIVRKIPFYEITYTGPIISEEKNIEELTKQSLLILDQKIKDHPEQYMWQHNRWKISYPPFVPKRYRHDAIMVILTPLTSPEELELLFRTYKGAYYIILKPHDYPWSIQANEIFVYKRFQDCFLNHFGPKLLIDLVGIPKIKNHYLKQALFSYITPISLAEMINNWKNAYADRTFF